MVHRHPHKPHGSTRREPATMQRPRGARVDPGHPWNIHREHAWSTNIHGTPPGSTRGSRTPPNTLGKHAWVAGRRGSRPPPAGSRRGRPLPSPAPPHWRRALPLTRRGPGGGSPAFLRSGGIPPAPAERHRSARPRPVRHGLARPAAARPGPARRGPFLAKVSRKFPGAAGTAAHPPARPSSARLGPVQSGPSPGGVGAVERAARAGRGAAAESPPPLPPPPPPAAAPAPRPRPGAGPGPRCVSCPVARAGGSGAGGRQSPAPACRAWGLGHACAREGTLPVWLWLGCTHVSAPGRGCRGGDAAGDTGPPG